jgi:hypothetical protein
VSYGTATFGNVFVGVFTGFGPSPNPSPHRCRYLLVVLSTDDGGNVAGRGA